MTSFAFILGVVPLDARHGAGAEMRRTLGTAVFSGMLGVTLFGIFLTPVFFYVIDWLSGDRDRARLAAIGVGPASAFGWISCASGVTRCSTTCGRCDAARHPTTRVADACRGTTQPDRGAPDAATTPVPCRPASK